MDREGVVGARRVDDPEGDQRRGERARERGDDAERHGHGGTAIIECVSMSKRRLAYSSSPIFLIIDMTARVAPEAMLMRATPIRSSAAIDVSGRATILTGASSSAFTSRSMMSTSARPKG